jgi:hypothetical protein
VESEEAGGNFYVSVATGNSQHFVSDYMRQVTPFKGKNECTINILIFLPFFWPYYSQF